MRTRGGVWLPMAAGALIIGLALVVFGLGRLHSPTGSPGGTRTGESPRAAAPLPRSAPVRIQVPAIGVSAPVLALGLNPDQTVQEPSLSQPSLTSWYRLGPAPGERGPAAFFGHIDTRASGPAVFYRLGQLTPGAQVRIARRDGVTAVFQITAVEQVPKSRFPTQRVYGMTAEPTIRLISCGGDFNRATGHYNDNIIAYGVLTGSTG
ncbi:class F sortase [Actinomadura barringtoniae]|nr:class F sortase [Actinomadura barringtoniae]